MNINKGWKRFMAVGCSHGIYADPNAIKGVLEFKERWKPHMTIHLGDFIDMSPFMSSARGKGDEIEPDIAGGLKFLTQLMPNIVMAGNHEVRLWREALSNDEVYSGYALRLISDIETHCKKNKALFVPYTGIWQCFKLGNYKFTHGTIYGETSARDMAEIYGNIIFAHTHKVSRMNGRRDDSPTGISVGTLTRRGAMEYANNRRSTFAWSQGMVFGYYNDDILIPWLHEQPHNQEKWILPL
jgi:hypothetical protein